MSFELEFTRSILPKPPYIPIWNTTVECFLKASIFFRIRHFRYLGKPFIEIFRIKISFNRNGILRTGGAAIKTGNAKGGSRFQDIHMRHAAFRCLFRVFHNVFFADGVRYQAATGTDLDADAALFAFGPVKKRSAVFTCFTLS